MPSESTNLHPYIQSTTFQVLPQLYRSTVILTKAFRRKLESAWRDFDFVFKYKIGIVEVLLRFK